MSLESKLNNALAGLPLVLANAAVNWTLENYKKQQWEGSPWPGRKRKTAKTTGRALLVQSGRLRRAIQVVGDHSFGVLGVPYARIHNEGGAINKAARSEIFVRNRYKRGPKSKMFGGMGAFKKGVTKGRGLSFKEHTINMPKRKFIGNSPQLREYLINEVKIYIKSKL